ncbi:plexin-B-like [Limulus polyphemus]|uniref:Plexin-B-like n=1 Tax=Limulus polyphemus TaxID=6850 RepID=A0ABM1TQ27_LIMPO|nr:plexin-B-like [Limulus polyphemus]
MWPGESFVHQSVSRITWICLALVWAITRLCHVFANQNPPIVASFTTFNKSVNVTHVVVDQHSGQVYVGATNWLYQFDSSLELEKEVKTGPVEDSIQCSPTDCFHQKKMVTNNVNKVLVIDSQAGKLIVCGSVHQGACRRHQLGNINIVEDLVPVPVAANDENSSTFAFIGPAEYFSYPSRVLYVATTNSRLGPYRDMVPTITSRSLEEDTGRLFGIIEKSFSTIARVDISFHLRDYYLVSYIYGFHSGGFIYFASVQRKSHLRALEEWGYVTRLARVCASDAGYNTYTEVTLQCVGPDGTNFNLLQDASVGSAGADLASILRIRPGADVFIGAFAASKDHTSKPSRKSALCIYSVAEIEQRFTENIHLCYNGSVLTRNMDYIAGSINQCPESGKAGNILNFCNETIKLNGTIPIQQPAAVTYSDTTLTSVGLATTDQHTVAFAGTSNGSLKKLFISNSIKAEEFEEIVVDSGYPIIPSLHLDSTKGHLYVSSPYKVSKLKLRICEQYNTCAECLQKKNPYCGWCSLERRCTIKAACQNATWSFTDRSSPRWLSLETKQCIDFQSVRPNQIPYTSSSAVSFIYHVIVNLAVRSSETDTDFISRPFAFYDCGVHKTCKACVTSSWACSWCVHQNMCTYNVSICSRRVIVGESNPANSLIKGRQHCPSFNLNEKIFLPNGVRKEIVIEVKNLLIPLDGFQCIIEIEGAKERVFARVRDSRVICSENIYTYQTDVGEVQAVLTVVWNEDTFIDRTNITLYKCHLLGSHGGRADCSLCLTRSEKYHCAWCGSNCGYSESCTEPILSSCPQPRIDWIHPLSGPIEGGTLVAIEGSNLGSSEEEIKHKIMIGGIHCIPEEYSISVRVVCRTGSSLAPMEAIVMVGNEAGVTKAQEMFYYKEVTLENVYPKLGPQSGGTRVYLTGNNLNIGSKVDIFLDDLPCRVERPLASSSQLSCRTTRAPVPSYHIKQLLLRIDNTNLTLKDAFLYTQDPTILRIEPLLSYFSGGRVVKVFGTNLTSIQQPRMVVFSQTRVVNETLCTVINTTMMMCPSPAVHSEVYKRSKPWIHQRHTVKHIILRIGFVMDDVQSVRELKHYYPLLEAHLQYVTDPQYYQFGNEGIKLYKGESLVIEGENLQLASTESEINVTIGTRPCNLTSLSMSQLVCLPPEVQPPGMDELGRTTENNLPLVVVRVGKNLRYEVGYLRYEVTKIYEFLPEAIGGIAAGGALLMLITLIILVVLRYKSFQAEREYKRIQLQMDTLENSVRSECKQAFAELQTDMTDLNKDIQTTGVPTLDHQTFVIRVFFPGMTENPLFKEFKQLNGPRTTYHLAMAQFEQLLYCKQFLLIFIETLENQRTFTIRDKVNVASLVMIILLEKLDYATEILQELLLKLINKYVETRHPQLMLRRTESVVEKLLTNWMAVCMYNYIKDSAGSAFFLLFNAVKHQVEKGPVDFITHDARYSLSEERLLREQTDFSIVCIQVVQEDLDEKLQCRVNSCDTITQVKAKILDILYKNTPFSLRPAVQDVNLEWHHGRGGHLVLSDEDLTTKTVNGWKRINTLDHYGIRETAVMSLVPNKKRGFQDPSNHSDCVMTPNSPRSNEKVCYWHLVKSTDELLSEQQQKDHSHKAIPEIFLTRLLSTKGTVQQFLDDFLSTILTANELLPPAIKWLFDLLDDAAAKHGISDPEVVHAWKSNSLPLRFWVNIMKNPDFIFDIEKTPTVDSSLSVIAQTFMDACSTTQHRLGKDSPSNKLLFARDIPIYRRMVGKYYQDITLLPTVSGPEMKTAMQNISKAHQGEVETLSSLKELYGYVVKYSEQIYEALRTEPSCQKHHLAHKLEVVACTLGGFETSVC